MIYNILRCLINIPASIANTDSILVQESPSLWFAVVRQLADIVSLQRWLRTSSTVSKVLLKRVNLIALVVILKPTIKSIMTRLCHSKLIILLKIWLLRLWKTSKFYVKTTRMYWLWNIAVIIEYFFAKTAHMRSTQIISTVVISWTKRAFKNSSRTASQKLWA